MSEEDSLAPISTQEVARFSLAFDNLKEHLGKGAPSVEGTVEQLAILEDLQSYRVFSSIGGKCGNWREHILEEYNMKGPLGLTTRINDDHKADLLESVQVWRTQFYDGIGDLVTVTPSTDLPTSKLRTGPEAFMELDADTLNQYPDVVGDLQEACGALLVGIPTCSEFISLRSVEGILRQWHSVEVEEETDYDGWYRAIKEMSNERYTDGPKELALLDYLRERRNEVAHPDRRSTRRDAERTLQNAFDVVEHLIIDMDSKDGIVPE
jgi:hypothetical protein